MKSMCNENIKNVYNFITVNGITLPLARAGQSLFNGYKVDFSELPLYNEEIFRLFFKHVRYAGV